MNCREANNRMVEEIKRILEQSGRPAILPNAVPNYDRDDSIYPEQIRVSFNDGATCVYERRVEQPAPQVIQSIEIIRKWKQGYVNKPRRRRRRG